jgi:plastocyanin
VRSVKSCVLAAGVACIATAVFALPATGAGKPRGTAVKAVHIADNFYSPHSVTVKPGGEVRWIWNLTTFGSHNVTLIKGPKGVVPEKFTSITAGGGFKFTRKFATLGTYRFRCTVHPSMHMTVVVKRQ